MPDVGKKMLWREKRRLECLFRRRILQEYPPAGPELLEMLL